MILCLKKKCLEEFRVWVGHEPPISLHDPAINLFLCSNKKMLRIPPASPFGSLTVAPVGQGTVPSSRIKNKAYQALGSPWHPGVE